MTSPSALTQGFEAAMEEAKTSLIKSPLILLSPPLHLLKKRAAAVKIFNEKFLPLQTAVFKLSYKLRLDKNLHTPDALTTRRATAYEAHTHSTQDTHSQTKDGLDSSSALHPKGSVLKGQWSGKTYGRSTPDGIQCWIGSIVHTAATALLDR